MGLYNEQIKEKGHSYNDRKSKKWAKNQRQRKHRRKMKLSNEYVPQFNRYNGWYD